MRDVRQRHLTKAVYENAMNFLIEETRAIEEQSSRALEEQSSIEDEAVTMAIRSHGLTQNLPCRMDLIETFLQYPTTSREFDSSRDDILSQAVTVAIRKKGLGATDR